MSLIEMVFSTRVHLLIVSTIPLHGVLCCAVLNEKLLHDLNYRGLS